MVATQKTKREIRELIDKEKIVFEWYRSHYNQINSTAVPGSISNRVLHKLVEREFKSNQGLTILEVGTNNGEHIPYVADDYDKYVATDVVLNPNFNKSAYRNVQYEAADLLSLPYADDSFDRVISTCVFHHLSDPDIGLRELRRVTKKNGKISILLPNDPGLMYRFLRGMTTLRKAKSAGLLFEVQLVHAIEHRSHYLAIQTFVNWVYKDDEIKKRYFPLKIKSYNMNALTCYTIQKSS